MLTKVDGFILSESPHGETSKIINVLTKDYGIIGIMCKGAKSMKSPFRSSTGAINLVSLNIYYKEGKLSLLKSSDIINSFSKIKNDITLISFATYLSELTMQVYKQNNRINVYDDFINILVKMEQGLDPLILTNILELKHLPLLGVGLNLDSCNKCGNKSDIVTIDGSFGGLICKNCLTNQVIVDPKVIKLLRMYYYVDIKSISSIDVKEEYKNTINHFINEYYEEYTGLYIKSKKFLESLL